MQRGILLLGLCALVGLAALAYAEEEPLHENELETKLPDMPWSKDSDAFVVQAPTNGLERLALLAEDDDDEEDDEDEEDFLGDDDSEDDEDDDSSADEELEEQEDWAPIQKRGMHSPNGLKIAAQGGMFSNDGKPPPTSDETKEWIKPGFFAKKRAEAARRAAADPTDLNGAKEARNALGELKNWAKKHKVSLRNKKKKSPVSKQKNLAKEAEEKITKPRAKGKSQFKPPAPLPDLKIKKLKWAEGHAPHLEPDAEEIRHKKEVARRRAEKEARIARENPWRKEYEQMKVEKKGLHVAAKRFHEEGVRMHKEEIAQNKRWKEEDARLNKIAKNKKMLRRRGAGGRRGKSKRKGKHGRKNKNKRVAEVPPRRADGASEYVHHPSATPSKGRPGLSGVEPQLRAHPAFAANGGPMPGTATHGVPTHFAVSSPDVVKSPNLHEHDDADVEEEAQHLLEQTGGDGEVDVEEMDDMMQAEEDRRANGDAGDWDMDLQLPVAQHVDNERLEDEEEVTEGWETDDF